jgi:hypothetical protein
MIIKDSIYDPLGIEIFAIDKTFESIFNGLKGVYFRLYYKESELAGIPLTVQSENRYYQRYREIGRIKRSYRYNDWAAKKKLWKVTVRNLKKWFG